MTSVIRPRRPLCGAIAHAWVGVALPYKGAGAYGLDMPTPLTNDIWDYESNCFVCEQSNEGGLRIPFQLDDDGDTVSASFRLGTTYSGAPALVHGGVSLALLDEAQACRRFEPPAEVAAPDPVPHLAGHGGGPR